MTPGNKPCDSEWLVVGELAEWRAAQTRSSSVPACPALRPVSEHELLAHLREAERAGAMVVLCEPRPGSLSQPRLEQLRAAAPLARFIRLQGTWCEGQQRSGPHLSGAWRVAWHTADPQLAQWAQAGTDGGLLAQPATLTAEEQWQIELASATKQPAPETETSRAAPARIALVTCSAAARGALGAICRAAGLEIVPYRDGTERAELILWETRPETLHDGQAVERARGGSDAPLIALCGFPRAEDFAAAATAGIAQVLAVPYRTEQLLWHVRRCLANNKEPNSLALEQQRSSAAE